MTPFSQMVQAHHPALLDRAIVTACSNEFVPWLLNLIGSLQHNYPDHPPVVVYDLGLRRSFVRELSNIRSVTLRRVAPFVPHWRACYTWKLYALTDAPARLVYFLDAASEVLRPLDEIFRIIDTDGYFCVNQKHAGWSAYLREIVPSDLLEHLGLLKDFCGDRLYFAAGNFGYKRGTIYQEIVQEAFELGKEGWTLGFSQTELPRSVGASRTPIVRDCRVFRHDQTVLNVVFYKRLKDVTLRDEAVYAGIDRDARPDQLIWNSRRNKNRTLRYWRRGVRYRQESLIGSVIRLFNFAYCTVCYQATPNRYLNFITTRTLRMARLLSGRT